MNLHRTHERVRDRSSAPPAVRALASPPTPRPALVESADPSWREIAKRLSEESSVRERRLRRALSLADAAALAASLLVAVYGLSGDALHPVALLLAPALIATAKTLGLYESDDQRIRKTTVDELPQLVQLGALLVLAVWLADWPLIGNEAGKGQALLLGLVFVVAALLGRRTARKLANRSHAEGALPVRRRRALLPASAHDLRPPRPVLRARGPRSRRARHARGRGRPPRGPGAARRHRPQRGAPTHHRPAQLQRTT